MLLDCLYCGNVGNGKQCCSEIVGNYATPPSGERGASVERAGVTPSMPLNRPYYAPLYNLLIMYNSLIRSLDYSSLEDPVLSEHAAHLPRYLATDQGSGDRLLAWVLLRPGHRLHLHSPKLGLRV